MEQWILALLANEGIHLETLINGPPPAITYTLEPVFGEPVEYHAQATERDRKVRNQLWQLMEDSFIETRNINYDRFVFLFSKQQKGKSAIY